MNFIEQLHAAQTAHQSLLCVGLDPDPKRFPARFQGQPNAIEMFCKAVVDATAEQACAFKPQIAYFAAHRAEDQLERVMAYIRERAPTVPVILDAKRGDIGSTAEQYAIEAFERYQADAVTLSPFMGWDTVEPYLQYEGKCVFLLCRTSNKGGDDFQNRPLADIPGKPMLYEHLARLAQGPWSTQGRVGLVVGATYPQEIARVREIAPDVALLIPGVGAQGGDALATVQAADQGRGLAVVNSSRAILYASSGDDFAQAAAAEALRTRLQLQSARRQA